jgi:hypothetical protein
VNHIDVYRKAFSIGEQDRDSVLCEVCGACQCQIHHINFKSQMGKNDIGNLIALCCICHDTAHGKVAGKELTRDQLLEITERRPI